METENLKHRIKNALIIIATGHFFEVGGLCLGKEGEDGFTVIGYSAASDLNNVSRTEALHGLAKTKSLFAAMTELSEELKAYIINRNIIYYLSTNNSKSEVFICKEIAGEITWFEDIKPCNTN